MCTIAHIQITDAFQREVALVRSHKNAKDSAETEDEEGDPEILGTDAILAQAAEDSETEDAPNEDEREHHSEENTEGDMEQNHNVKVSHLPHFFI
jgi:hypothetical protein